MTATFTNRYKVFTFSGFIRTEVKPGESSMLASMATYLLWLLMIASALCIVVIGGAENRVRQAQSRRGRGPSATHSSGVPPYPKRT